MGNVLAIGAKVGKFKALEQKRGFVTNQIAASTFKMPRQGLPV